MFPYSLLAAFCLFSLATSQSISAELLPNVTQAFSESKVVPDVLETFNPSAFLYMTFSDASNQKITPAPGELLSVNQTQSEPEYFLVAENTTALESYGNLVLIMVDPDAPRTRVNTSISQVIHLLGGDFTLGSSGSMLRNTSKHFFRYWEPRPQADSEPHRYVLLAYPQPPNFDTAAANYFANVLEDPRFKFNVSSFAEALGLGGPIAGNFFTRGPNVTATPTEVVSTSLPSSTTSKPIPTLTPLAGSASRYAAPAMKILGFSMAALILL